MKKISFFLVLSGLLFSYTQPSGESQKVFPIGDQGITTVSDPGEQGPYDICSDVLRTSEGFEGKEIKLFVPVLNGKKCVAIGRYDLVLISHANGVDLNGSLGIHSYDQLATHLASNAFIVGVIERESNQPGENLKEHLKFLYTNSPVKNFLSNNIALIGHSAGGKEFIENAHLVSELGGNLRALVLFAPFLQDPSVFLDLKDVTDAFLGIHVSHDLDPGTFGSKGPGLPMRSTFKYYDNAGAKTANVNTIVTPGVPIPTVYSIEKDMLYITTAPTTGTHYFQNFDYAKAYTNAFLQLHVHGHKEFQNFFKFQQTPPNIDELIIQQHHDKTRLVVADFENGEFVNNLGGTISEVGNNIQAMNIGNVYELDDFSPHDSKVLMFNWHGNNRSESYISFLFENAQNISAYKHLSFRTSQIYHPKNNPMGITRNFGIELISASGSAFAEVQDHGGALIFPIKVEQVPAGVALDEQTKNAMRSYLIPLNAFSGVELSSVTEIRFHYGNTGEGFSTFILDDIEFYLNQ